LADRYFSDAELAALYDLFSPRDRRSDYDFYLPMAMSARAVLDVGCGTGSFLHELRDAGHQGRLCGLDPAGGMLAQARRRSDVEWIQGDLGSVRWNREFDFIVMTGHAFQALVEDQDVRLALSAVRAALTPDGSFAFESRNPQVREWERWAGRYAGKVTDAAGRGVRMDTDLDAPFDGRVVAFRHIFSCPDWTEPQVSHSTLRFLDAEAIAAFLDEAGLTIGAQFGNWDRTPLTEQSPEIITVARRAQST
jgi:SAM-dependent methyltransferase